MPTVTVNIAGQGTPLNGGGESQVGHMWYSLTDSNGNTDSYGFSPVKEATGIDRAFGPGTVNAHEQDDNYYQGPRAYTTTLEITQEQYDTLKNFGENPSGHGFSMFYNGLSNSCIDFTYKALEAAGMNPLGYQGFVWPTWNAPDVADFILNNHQDWVEVFERHPYFAKGVST